MNLYIAGNFPQMADPELEKECYKIVTNQLGSYHRLVSFWFKDHAERVIQVKKEIDDGE